ncbi:MAG TPA: asparagine synthase (glutamine-hydrolyzing) [Chloroflexota bacterium]|nr:asparagine synthase (glutamine-hydrolyzing) [Chloroflexota bacterium]
MCGIAGILSLSGSPVTAEEIGRMNALMAHRGPDDEGIWLEEGVGLGNRRLAIIDLTPAGHQPMVNVRGDLVITFNGELYNFRELRAELRQRGYQFRSESDVEVVLTSYDHWGVECLSRFNGHFAFCLWDRSQRRALLARDRFGVKPLYYAMAAEAVTFSSEIRPILSLPQISPKLDHLALQEYFTFQNVLSDRTLLEGIRLLPAGSYLEVNLAAGDIRFERYWDYAFCVPSNPTSFDEAAEALTGLLECAVSRQLVSDVPVGCFLSGGLDSGCLASIASRCVPGLPTFTIGFEMAGAGPDDRGFDERVQARELAGILGTRHYEDEIGPVQLEAALPDLILHLEDLRMGQSYPNHYAAALATRQVKVVLEGTGGDELLAGYPWRYPREAETSDKDAFLRAYYCTWQRLVPEQQQVDFFRPDISRELSAASPYDSFCAVMERAFLQTDTEHGFLNACFYFELRTFLQGLLLVDDKLAMAHSLENRAPFLDNDVVDFLLKLPLDFKLAGRSRDDSSPRRDPFRRDAGKRLLRASAKRILPAGAPSRPKQGFSGPDATWFRGANLSYIRSTLLAPDAAINDFLEPDFVAKRLQEHVLGHVNHRLLIWSLLSFEWWLRLFLCGEPRTAGPALGLRNRERF